MKRFRKIVKFLTMFEVSSKEHAHQFAEKHQRPFHYLQSSSLSKEDYARTIMEQDDIRQGLVCVLSCVEPCQTYSLRRDRKSKRLVLTPARRKCLFLYFYFVDREFGLMHVRLQTWLPMSIQVCLNGREYLANRLDKAGIGYEKRGNCFTRIDDLPRAQRMMDDLERRNWAHFLSAFARRLNPWLDGRNGLEENSIKMYDKQGSVLRIETTINNPRRFNIRRKATRHGQLVTAWCPMRKSVADTARRVEISRAANERFLEALGVVGEPSPVRQTLDPVSKRIVRKGRPYRALRPIEPEEAKLFSILLDGTFLLQGFRNRHIRCRLYGRSERNPKDRRRSTGRVTRLLRLLRAHGLIRKVSKTFYYRVTSRGNQIMATALRLRQIPALALGS